MAASDIGCFAKHVFKVVIGVLRVVLHDKLNCYASNRFAGEFTVMSTLLLI